MTTAVTCSGSGRAVIDIRRCGRRLVGQCVTCGRWYQITLGRVMVRIDTGGRLFRHTR